MKVKKILPKKNKNIAYVTTSTLILLAFASAFLPRVLDNAGAPSLVNFLHFALVPLACGFALFKTRIKDKKQIYILKALLVGLLSLLAEMTASALLNNAGIVNLVLDYLLKAEPFLMLLAIICVPVLPVNYEKVRTWFNRFCFFHLFLAFFQYYVLKVHLMAVGPGSVDNVQGVFFVSGSGHVVGASVSMTFSLYYLVSAKTAPIWLRGFVFLAAFWQMLLSDAKQVILTFLVAGLLLLFTKVKDIAEALKYLIAATLLVSLFIWCLQNVPAFKGFNTWIRPQLYGPNGEATLLKTASIRIIPSYYESPLHPWLGLGPGHTVGRLGGWMIKQYWELLEPLGATLHPVRREVWEAVGASWLGDQSSMFSPLFGWAGIWGDLGFLGLGVYLYLWFIVWHYLCLDDFSRFVLLTVFAHGLIFSQMEEPGFMLFIVLIIGLQWQKHQLNKKVRQNALNKTDSSIRHNCSDSSKKSWS